MDKQRFRHLNITLNQNFSERHDIPQMHFTMTDLKWLMEQAQRVDELEKELEEMTEDRNMYRSNSLDWQGEEEEDAE